MMSPGKGLWEMKPTTEWQMFGVECPLVAITGTPTGDRDNIIFFLFFSFFTVFWSNKCTLGEHEILLLKNLLYPRLFNINVTNKCAVCVTEMP